MVSFLVLLGSFLAPIAGVFIVNAKDPRDLDDPEILAPVPKLRIGALVAWACGATIGLMATPRESLGLGWLHLTTIPALDAVIAAGLITFALKIWHSDEPAELKAGDEVFREADRELLSTMSN